VDAVNEEQMLEELAAIDEPSEPDELDVEVPDPEELDFDAEPDGEGDDADAEAIA
jgi:hypothetical protein